MVEARKQRMSSYWWLLKPSPQLLSTYKSKKCTNTAQNIAKFRESVSIENNVDVWQFSFLTVSFFRKQENASIHALTPLPYTFSLLVLLARPPESFLFGDSPGTPVQNVLPFLHPQPPAEKWQDSLRTSITPALPHLLQNHAIHGYYIYVAEANISNSVHSTMPALTGACNLLNNATVSRGSSFTYFYLFPLTIQRKRP